MLLIIFGLGMWGLLMTVSKSNKLNEVELGSLVEIVYISDPHTREQALKFDITKGTVVKVVGRAYCPPAVITKKENEYREITIGEHLAAAITIKKVSPTNKTI